MSTKRYHKQKRDETKRSSRKKEAKVITPVISHFKVVEAEHTLHLPPVFVGKTLKGVEESLNRMLTKYHDSVDGVVLSYWDIKLLSSVGKIMYDSPFIHFNISCQMLVFAPQIGTRIVGTVNKQSHDHIGLLIHNLFNASIPSSHIPTNEYKFVADHNLFIEDDDQPQKHRGNRRKSQNKNARLDGNWVHLATDGLLETGSEVEFIVTEILRANEMLSILGSLINIRFVCRPPTFTEVIVDE